MSTIRPEITGRAGGVSTGPSKQQENKRARPKPRSGTLAMSIPQFCDRHSISEALYFELQKQGRGPDTLEAGGRVLITDESARKWRKKYTKRATKAA